jgi:hypothetical protein
MHVTLANSPAHPIHVYHNIPETREYYEKRGPQLRHKNARIIVLWRALSNISDA